MGGRRLGGARAGDGVDADEDPGRRGLRADAASARDGVADSGNGASNVLDWGRYLFINTELTVHFARPPGGEWVCLEAETQIAEGGAGLASSVLSDRTGPVARGEQALLVAPR